MSFSKPKFQFKKGLKTTRRSLLFMLGYGLALSTTLSSCNQAEQTNQQPAPTTTAISGT